MEKKRLLSALMAAALAAWAAPALAEEDPLRGIRTKPEKAALAGAEKLKEKLYEPDFAGAQKMLSEIKTPKAAQTAQIMELLSVKPPPAGMPPQKTTGTKGSESKLFYFFSFSMPRLSLREAAAESAAAGAVMVLRGLYEDDPAKTASRISEMIGRSGAEVWIDPALFGCFSVKTVPQIVLARRHSPGADCKETRHVKVSGDVSVRYALGVIKKEDADAGVFIRRLRKSGFYGD